MRRALPPPTHSTTTIPPFSISSCANVNALPPPNSASAQTNIRCLSVIESNPLPLSRVTHRPTHPAAGVSKKKKIGVRSRYHEKRERSVVISESISPFDSKQASLLRSRVGVIVIAVAIAVAILPSSSSHRGRLCCRH